MGNLVNPFRFDVAVTKSVANVTGGSVNTGGGLTGTVQLGAHDAASRIFALVSAGGVEDSLFTVTAGGTPSLVQRIVPTTNRVAELWEVTGNTGSSFSFSVGSGAFNTFVAGFRTVGYTPIGTNPLVVDGQNGTTTPPASIAVSATVPAGGAALVLAKRYEDLTGPTGFVKSIDNGLTGADALCSGYWQNSGAQSTDNYTGSTNTAASVKYVLVGIMAPA